MSLLLDALKKAAKDKQDAAGENKQSSAPEERDAVVSSDEELVLSLEETDSDESGESEPTEVTQHDEVEHQPAAQATTQKEPELTLEAASVRATTTTVSDEALHMLVFKTNREYRRKQKIVWSSITITSAIILLLGGYYFYSNMVKDVESLERKHRIAIQKVNAEIIKRKRPELIAGLTNKKLEDVQYMEVSRQKKSISTGSQASSNITGKTKNSERDTNQSAGGYSFQATQTQDAVGVLLETGWSAYDRGDYDAAAQAYNSALQNEPNNRDAMLGIAAISVKQGQRDKARSVYAQLLRLNPRDPIAVAAMVNLDQSSIDKPINNLSESKLKLLLKRQPQAAHINFALGNISAQKKRWPEAQSYYFNAWQADESNADYSYNLAVSLDQIGKKQQAIKFYQQSIDLAAVHNHSFSQEAAQQRMMDLTR